MAIFASDNIGVLIFGILGNLVSFVVFLAPVPTFVRVVRKKSTEGFQSVPYVVALFSGMMWLYYATLKPDEALLITINSFGCVIETIYISIFIAYSPKKARQFTLRLLLLLNLGGFCLVLFLSHYVVKNVPNQIRLLGWLNVAVAVGVFAAPLSIMRVVIRTKSVEFMPFGLSFFLTLSAVMWLFYGVLLKDFYVALPNILGLVFGVLQMILYAIYRNKKIAVDEKKIAVLDDEQQVYEHQVSQGKGVDNKIVIIVVDKHSTAGTTTVINTAGSEVQIIRADNIRETAGTRTVINAAEVQIVSAGNIKEMGAEEDDDQIRQHGKNIVDIELSTAGTSSTASTSTAAEVQYNISGSNSKEISDEEDDNQIDQHGIEEENNKNHHRNGKSMEDCYSIIIQPAAATVKCEA